MSVTAFTEVVDPCFSDVFEPSTAADPMEVVGGSMSVTAFTEVVDPCFRDLVDFSEVDEPGFINFMDEVFLRDLMDGVLPADFREVVEPFFIEVVEGCLLGGVGEAAALMDFSEVVEELCFGDSDCMGMSSTAEGEGPLASSAGTGGALLLVDLREVIDPCLKARPFTENDVLIIMGLDTAW